MEDSDYQMIVGHRRLFAVNQIGMDKIPAIVKEYTDDEAILAMVDSNLQREEILPSEKAFAYKMKYEAMKRQGKRNDLHMKLVVDFAGADCEFYLYIIVYLSVFY